MEKRDIWDDHWHDLDSITTINPAQIYRHKLLVSTLIEVSKDSKNIIDFGSGQGDMIELFSNSLPLLNYYGLELSKVGVEISKIKNPTAQFFQCDLLDDERQIKSLYAIGDIGICAEVLEHLDNPGYALNNIAKYIKPNGILIITVPGGPMNAFEKSIGHRRHFKIEEIAKLISYAGFDVTLKLKAGFPFFNLYKIISEGRG